jgi:hypothetical protein
VLMSYAATLYIVYHSLAEMYTDSTFVSHPYVRYVHIEWRLLAGKAEGLRTVDACQVTWHVPPVHPAWLASEGLDELHRRVGIYFPQDAPFFITKESSPQSESTVEIRSILITLKRSYQGRSTFNQDNTQNQHPRKSCIVVHVDLRMFTMCT